MAFGKYNYIEEMNRLLLTKRFENDKVFNLNILESKLQKNPEKFNYALRYIAEHNDGVLMYHIILSLNQFLDPMWIVENVLDDVNKEIVKNEMRKDFPYERI